MLGPAVFGEVEGGVADVFAQRQVAVVGDDLVLLGRTLGAYGSGHDEIHRMAARRRPGIGPGTFNYRKHGPVQSDL